jgi:hypothetical protein
MWKKLALKKTWINDLEEVKSVDKCQCGKKCEKFPWKNITYLVVTKCSQRAQLRASPPHSGKLQLYIEISWCLMLRVPTHEH